MSVKGSSRQKTQTRDSSIPTSHFGKNSISKKSPNKKIRKGSFNFQNQIRKGSVNIHDKQELNKSSKIKENNLARKAIKGRGIIEMKFGGGRHLSPDIPRLDPFAQGRKKGGFKQIDISKISRLASEEGSNSSSKSTPKSKKDEDKDESVFLSPQQKPRNKKAMPSGNKKHVKRNKVGFESQLKPRLIKRGSLRIKQRRNELNKELNFMRLRKKNRKMKKTMSLVQMRTLLEKAMFIDKKITIDVSSAFSSNNGISYIFVSIFKPENIPLGNIVNFFINL